MRRFILPVVGGCLACGPRAHPTVPPEPRPQQSGVQPAPSPTVPPVVSVRIRYPDGRTVTNALVRLGSSTSDSESLVRTDGDGLAVIPPGVDALSLATESGFVHTISLGAQRELQLDSACTIVSGAVHAPRGQHQAIRLRLTQAGGDRAVYVSDTKSGGVLQACVPKGTYAIEGEADEWISPRIVYEVQGPTLRVADISLQSRALASGVRYRDVLSSTIVPYEPSALMSTIPSSTRIVAIGEQTHGTSEFISLRRDIVLELARRGPVTLLLEMGFGESAALEEYVQGSRDDLDTALAEIGTWVWDVDEFAAFARELREKNSQLPHNRRIHVAGIDMQRSERTLAGLQSALSKAKRFNRLLASLNSLSDRKAFRQLSKEERTRTLTAVRELRSGLLAAGRRDLLIFAQVLEQFIESTFISSLVETVQYRDKSMAQNALALHDRYGGMAVLWGHNAHIAKSPYQGVEGAGIFLEKALGNRYMAIGTMVGSGTFLAWDQQGKIGVSAQRLPTPAPHLLEATLLELTTKPAFVILHSPQLEALRDNSTWMRSVSAVWSGDQESWDLRNVGRSFDILVFIPQGHATTLTANAASRVGPNRSRK
jgi:erythromycin esterase